MTAVLGRKVGMTQIFDAQGLPVAVTVIDTTACRVSQVKTRSIDGYEAVQLQLGKVRKEARDAQTGQPLEGTTVTVKGVTKGKGFQGVMKRHGFKGKDASHGTHEYFRHGGSVGTNTFPGRILKGKAMPGHQGNANRTVTHLTVMSMQDGILVLKGSVPGARGGLVLITSEK